MTLMGRRRQASATVVAFMLTTPVYSAAAQADSPNAVASPATSADPHKAFAHSLTPGTRVKVKLRDGGTLKAAFVAVRGDALVVLPKGGAEQAVKFESIAKLTRDRRSVAGKVGRTVGIAALSVAAAVVILSVIGCAQESHPNLLFCEDTSLHPRR
jgi:hypothetical protein